MDIKEKIKKLPEAPGVYLMKGKNGAVIYVGKAASLKKRVASYFRNRPVSARLSALIDNIEDVDFMVTSNEAEALILEAALIKSRRPKYNVALRDDKNYPLLKLTVNERFPKLIITRQKRNDGAMYFGPYTSARLLREAVNFLRRAFLFRTCNKLPKTVCLNYYLKQCLAPCGGKSDEKAYRGVVNQVIMFLDGRRPEVLKELEEKMNAAAVQKKYEEATRYRDQISALTQFIENGRERYAVNNQLQAMKGILGLKKEPAIIEAFDVSNISGKEAVGSMIIFKEGKPHKQGYRKFRIKDTAGIDDYRMMREIVRRSFQRLLDEGRQHPDLVVIDGGKGHLLCAKEELDKLGLGGIPMMSIAKEFEHIFLPDRPQPVKLPANSPVLYLIQRIRDEAHRFAIRYHKGLRGKLVEESVLDSINGIGPKRKTDLIKYFGSIEGIKKAPTADLMRVRGINKRLADEIKKRIV
ncbi:MAG: excinuclease ABC subunit UvrC [Candidatus Omnitrophica bacterium]|nr:excinuclease ABC subunit UvrC [Candidatus Omnitrophota bacterium]